MTFIRMRPSECGPTFHGNGHDGLPPDAAPSDAGLRASNERFIDFDPPLEPILYPGSHCKPVSMQHGPRRLVAPQAPAALQLKAESPFFEVVIRQAASNHTVNGVRVLANNVPAVAETQRLQRAHRHLPFTFHRDVP